MRQINKFISAFLIATFAWVVSVNSHAQSQSDPVALLQYIANAIYNI